MSRLIAYFTLTATLLLTGITHAEDSDTNSYNLLEMATVTIRMTGGYPYGELSPCPDCPLRLLPFTPDAQLYLQGRKTEASALQDGQTLIGTVFIRNKPIDAISEIVAK
ncbi:hypothetical protein [Pseudomonas sp.]|uniref:hypothetical protein n=1 Tax=Pseudomonas sp. TaxID=306 RepID=UPI00299EC7FD|nr:hypothetical protein [Pseudomonas sp.]MDX1367462.1 hypothetical protein [Pseudomonas sp.]